MPAENCMRRPYRGSNLGVLDSETLLMGYIHIPGRKLVAEVNSAQRAKAFRLLISNIPAATARYRRTRRQSHEKMLQSPSYETDFCVTRH